MSDDLTSVENLANAGREPNRRDTVIGGKVQETLISVAMIGRHCQIVDARDGKAKQHAVSYLHGDAAGHIKISMQAAIMRIGAATRLWESEIVATHAKLLRLELIKPVKLGLGHLWWLAGSWSPNTSARLEFEFTLQVDLADHHPRLESVLLRLDGGASAPTLVGAVATCFLELQIITLATTAGEALREAANLVKGAFAGAKITGIVVPAPDLPAAVYPILG